MDPKQYQGLLFGLIIGIALCIFMYVEMDTLVSLILIPIGALMGLAPQLLKPKEP